MFILKILILHVYFVFFGPNIWYLSVIFLSPKSTPQIKYSARGDHTFEKVSARFQSDEFLSGDDL